MKQDPITPAARTVLGRGSYSEVLRIGEILRKETVGGMLLVAAAGIAIIWANSPVSESYFAMRDYKIGYAPWHLELSLGAWAADGLLAIFFFLVGLELKREFVAGDLRQFSKSIVPVSAAVGGVAIPAIIYAVINLTSPETLRGWAIPTATDIAFAVAVLAIIGSHLPSALRIFLLTLAVVDDLLATGGTAEAGIKLIERLGAVVVGLAVVVDLPELGGRKRIEAMGIAVHALCEFEGL